jgi:hypothetical protein
MGRAARNTASNLVIQRPSPHWVDQRMKFFGKCVNYVKKTQVGRGGPAGREPSGQMQAWTRPRRRSEALWVVSR